MLREMTPPSATIVLASGDARATVLPRAGANVSRWSVGDWEILSSPPDAESLAKAPARWGIPVLFPFPNRIRGAKYEYQGKIHQWSPVDAEGNAKHGFALREPWDVTEQAADRAKLRIDVGARPHLLAMYPFPCTIEWSISLSPRALALDARVTNTGPGELPMGFGIHPYFALPLSPSGSREATVIRVPARETWVLESMLPTGARAPVTGKLALAEGRALGSDAFDDVLTGLDGDAATITDPASGRRLTLEAPRADGFHEWVVYAPPDRVALEPYTCPTDALNLAARGAPGASLIVLEPGGSWTGRITLRADDAPSP